MNTNHESIKIQKKFPECLFKKSKITSIKNFWTKITQRTPLYGADVRGSIIYENEKSTWNLNNLDTVLTFYNKRWIKSSKTRWNQQTLFIHWRIWDNVCVAY